MKIIDLLNKIANAEEVPRKFTYKGYLWEYDVKNKMWFYYFGEGKSHRFDRLFYLNMILNEEIKILEEEKKIPEKIKTLKHSCNFDRHEEILYENQVDLANKITEILDYLKSKGE